MVYIFADREKDNMKIYTCKFIACLFMIFNTDVPKTPEKPKESL